MDCIAHLSWYKIFRRSFVFTLIVIILLFFGVQHGITVNSQSIIQPSSERLLRSVGRLHYCNVEILPKQDSTFDDETSLLSLLDFQPSDKCSLSPAIDFTKETLIGAVGEIPGGCSDERTPLIVKVTKDDKNKMYNHISLFIGSHPCAGNASYAFWVRVPKLPASYTVKFEKRSEPNMMIYVNGLPYTSW